MDWTTVVVTMGGMVTTIGSGLGVYLRMKHTQNIEMRKLEAELRKQDMDAVEVRGDNQQRRDATALDQYRELVGRLERQNRLLEATVAKQQQSINHLAERDTLCQIRMTRYWGWMAQASDRINLLTGALRQAGHDPGYPPLESLKPPPEFDDQAGFIARTTAQEAKALSDAIPKANGK